MRNTTRIVFMTPLLAAALSGCLGQPTEGIAESSPAQTTVKMDFLHRPLPEIPLPNDLATRYDASSPTLRRINASMIAPTALEVEVRTKIDQLDGWGTMQPIAVPFTGLIDLEQVIEAHHDPLFDFSDDLFYLINIDRDSPDYGELVGIDIGGGSFPATLEQPQRYGPNDPRGFTMTLAFDEADEDLNNNGVLDPAEDANRNRVLDPGEDRNGNGILDPSEDTDADGHLDEPNYLPGRSPAIDDITARADAIMTWWERETNTLIAKPMMPLRERTTYAFVISNRLRDAAGQPVGSPYPFPHHGAQTDALEPLAEVLPNGMTVNDIAFAFTYTTGTATSDWIAVRDGLYGHGTQAHLGRDFPAEIGELFPLRDAERFPNAISTAILYQEQFLDALNPIISSAFGIDTGSREFAAISRSLNAIDFHVMGSFESPQLFNRYDEDGRLLRWNQQSWPEDLETVPAPARSETIYFWMTVPRAEISPRGDGQPAPIVILGHGYGSSRLEALTFAGFLAQNGVATIAIDDVSHGLNIDPETEEQITTILDLFGLGPFLDAIKPSRAIDVNGDGTPDSGADFWSSYLFHTRDVVRQTVLDHMQLVRVLRTFDGSTRWKLDIDGDGENELAGDFDADGVVDLATSAGLSGLGGSLGGMSTTLLGALEPEMDVIVPISGGGGLADLGVRSIQGGIAEAFVLWTMAPVYLITRNADTGSTAVDFYGAALNRRIQQNVANVEGVEVGDTVVIRNVENGELDCGYMAADGTARLNIAADEGDRLHIAFYMGPALVTGDDECAVIDGAEMVAEVTQFGSEVEFERRRYRIGDPLVSPTEGLGLKRAEPDLRRFQGLGQLVIDRADPAVYARHLSMEPLTYPGTNETTSVNALIVTTVGDMNVPASGGVTLGRAAGFIPWNRVDERYGVPANQVLIDTYMVEAVHTLKRYVNAATGEGAHIDVENFSRGTDIWGENIPRLDPPLHLWGPTVDRDGNEFGGISGAIFPYPIPEGQHGFPFPGQLPDRGIEECEAACTTPPCGCRDAVYFDTGTYLFNVFGRYVRTGGRELSIDECNGDNSCDDLLEPPPLRPNASLR